MSLSQLGFPVPSVTWARTNRQSREQGIRSPRDSRPWCYKIRRSEGEGRHAHDCRHRQQHAPPAPTPRVKRNFGLSLESTYFLLRHSFSPFALFFLSNRPRALSRRQLLPVTANVTSWSLAAFTRKKHEWKQVRTLTQGNNGEKMGDTAAPSPSTSLVSSAASDAYHHPQPYALLAPTPRAKRNFGLISELTYFLLMTVVTDYRLLTNFQANVHIET